MFRRLNFTIVAFFALAGSVAQARPHGQLTGPETIHGSRVDAHGLTLRVGSNGCTAKDSFLVRVRGSDRRPKVTALRVRPDYCKASFRIVEFTWSYRELGVRRGARIRVMNPVAEPAPALNSQSSSPQGLSLGPSHPPQERRRLLTTRPSQT